MCPRQSLRGAKARVFIRFYPLMSSRPGYDGSINHLRSMGVSVATLNLPPRAPSMVDLSPSGVELKTSRLAVVELSLLGLEKGWYEARKGGI
jgi:hypothetical protein